MADLSILAGATSQSINIDLYVLATGAPQTGLVYNSLALTAYYSFTGSNGGSVAITLATLAAANSTWSSGGFKEIDATNMPGLYRFDIPNAALAAAKGRDVVITFTGFSGMRVDHTKIELTGWDNQDGVRGGMTALPNAAAAAANGLHVLGTNATAVSYTAGMTISSTAGDALTLTSTNATSNGLVCNGNTSGAGIKATGGSTGHGIVGIGGATSGDGANFAATTSGNGMTLLAVGVTKDGLNTTGAVTSGMGIRATGGATSGDGIRAIGSATSGGGMRCTASAGQGLYCTSSYNNAVGYGFLVDCSGNATAAVKFDGSVVNNGSGLLLLASGTGHGISSTGGGTGHGILSTGGATSGDGIRVTAGASGIGLNAIGVGTTMPGIKGTGGATTSNGMQLVGGATSGDGLGIQTTSGHGINLAPVGTSKHGFFSTGGNGGTSDGMKLAAGTGGVDLRANQTGNITGTVDTVTTTTTATNLTNAPTNGDLTAAMKTSVQTAADAAITANALVLEIEAETDGIAAISTATPLTAAQIATGVWQDATAGDFTIASSIGKALYISNVAPGAAGGHFIAGTNAATTITTGLTTHLIGTVDTVTAVTGLTASNLDATISSIPTANANADALLDRASGIETGYTFRQVMRLIGAVLLGKNTATPTSDTFRDINDTKNRVTATDDAQGDRTVITLDAS